eukprot:SAG31_NODE_10142_length_1178_cov_1.779425_1_plen_50_part_10
MGPYISYMRCVVQMGAWFPTVFEHAGPVFPLDEVFPCFVSVIPTMIQDPF